MQLFLVNAFILIQNDKTQRILTIKIALPHVWIENYLYLYAAYRRLIFCPSSLMTTMEWLPWPLNSVAQISWLFFYSISTCNNMRLIPVGSRNFKVKLLNQIWIFLEPHCVILQYLLYFHISFHLFIFFIPALHFQHSQSNSIFFHTSTFER